MRKIVGIHDKLPLLETLPLSLQHLFAMFGATVLVPILMGVDASTVLLMNGIGTLIYTIVTKGGIPAYLGSSFAFLGPTAAIAVYSHALSGFIVFGLFFIAMSFVIKFFGVRWINVVMPPAVMGAVVAVIGFALAPNAAKEAGLVPGSAAYSDYKVMIVSLGTLFVGVLGSVLFRGFLKIIPILISVVVGYSLAVYLGFLNQPITDGTITVKQAISQAHLFALPHFQAPVFDISAILIILPACLVVLAEHIGHLIVTSNITGTDLVKDPGLHRSILGNGIATVISGFVGSPPNTTYGENIGVMAITRVYSVWVIRGAAIISVCLALIGKISMVIKYLPAPVIGGVSLLLYGIIASSGIRMLVEKKVDFSKSFNLVLASVTFIVGISGATINLGSVPLNGMSLSAVTGMLLSLVFYGLGKLGFMNEPYQPTQETQI